MHVSVPCVFPSQPARRSSRLQRAGARGGQGEACAGRAEMRQTAVSRQRMHILPTFSPPSRHLANNNNITAVVFSEEKSSVPVPPLLLAQDRAISLARASRRNELGDPASEARPGGSASLLPSSEQTTPHHASRGHRPPIAASWRWTCCLSFQNTHCGNILNSSLRPDLTLLFLIRTTTAGLPFFHPSGTTFFLKPGRRPLFVRGFFGGDEVFGVKSEILTWSPWD